MRTLAKACVASLMLLLGGPAIAAPLTVLSSTPERATGGDALIQVDAGVKRLKLNGEDVTSALGPADPSGRRLGLISNLRVGANTLAATADGRQTELVLTNHPISGPVFSGPHQKPFICETDTYKLPDGKTLGAAQDANCWAPTNVQYLYKSAADGKFKPLGAGGAPEAIARTRTTAGVETDIVVRLETGVINRAIYQVAVLARPGEEIRPGAAPKGWNGRLIYSFGGGCGPAYRQGRSLPGVGVIDNAELSNEPLEKGFAVASSTLNVLGANCNDLISAETAMMVKERFIETFGPPKHTFGFGGSGGSMQQNLMQANYPGILDGLVPGHSFPDSLTVFDGVMDCPLIANYFGKSKAAWSDAQKTAVVGYAKYDVCAKAWSSFVPRLFAPNGDGCAVASVVIEDGAPKFVTTKETRFKTYDKATAPDGVRCSYFDNAVNVWGRNAKGYTRTTNDNVGVQYGLAAFNGGVISFDQFLDLNRQVGGYDPEGQFVADRSQADQEALEIAYATGRVNQHAGMDAVPIIDVRGYVDTGEVDVHTAYTTAVARARRTAAGQRPENFVTWVAEISGSMMADLGGETPLREMSRQSVYAMDAWLDAIDADQSDAPRAVKVARNRPGTLHDACFLKSGRVDETRGVSSGGCFTRFPDHGDPRTAAGEPLTRIHLKCALKPVSAAAYKVKLSDTQLAELKQVFPQGVCDYAKPPVGYRKPAGVWLNYSASKR